MSLEHQQPFRQAFRVYYDNTDATGVVYHAEYLKFFERTRTEWLRACGLEQDQMRQEQGVLFLVSRLQLDFQRPARFNQLVQVDCSLERLRRASILLSQRLWLPGENLACSAQVRIAVVDAAKLRPAPLPPQAMQLIEAGPAH